MKYRTSYSPVVTTEQIAVGLGAAAVVLSALAAFFSFQANSAARGAAAAAARRWDDMTRPQPHLTFTSPPPPNQPVEVEVENPGGAMAAGAVVAAYGDFLFASVLTMPEKALPRRLLLPSVMKAWQPVRKPGFLMVAGRDVSGRWWDCLDGTKEIKDPKRWIEQHLRDLRLQGAVSFPELSGASAKK